MLHFMFLSVGTISKVKTFPVSKHFGLQAKIYAVSSFLWIFIYNKNMI